MKSIFLTAVSFVAVVTGNAFATQTCKVEEIVAPQYNHRLVALQPSLSYEKLGSNSMYVGFESFVAGALRGKNDTTTIGVIDARIGHSFNICTNSSITPVIGASIFRDLEETASYVSSKDRFTSTQKFSRNPFFYHGTIGFMGDYNFTNTFGIGIAAKALIGNVWGADYDGLKNLSYGFHGSLPLTFRFGKAYHWDFRMEPYALILNDYNNYVGLKAGLGYRF